MMDEPTRCGNILDLFLTSNQTLVQKIQIVPGIAENHITAADVNVKPQIAKQTLRSVPLYKKANWDFLSIKFRNFSLIFLINYENKYVEEV